MPGGLYAECGANGSYRTYGVLALPCLALPCLASPQPPSPQPPAPHSVHLDFCVPAAAAALFRLNVYSMLCTVCSTMHAARRVPIICCTTYAVHFHSMSAPRCAYIVYYTSVPLCAALRPASAAFGELHTASLFPPNPWGRSHSPPPRQGGGPFLNIKPSD